MPSSSFQQTYIDRAPISLGIQTPESFRPPMVLISTLSIEACGEELTGMGASNMASATYPSASRVLAYPFEIADDFLVMKVFWVNGTTASTDTADVGVYNEPGTSLIVHGSAAITGGSIVQEVDCTDTLLTPGRYWCAYIQGGVTATPMICAIDLALARSMGCAQQAGSGSALGSTFTPAALAAANIPWCGIAGRTQVA